MRKIAISVFIAAFWFMSFSPVVSAQERYWRTYPTTLQVVDFVQNAPDNFFPLTVRVNDGFASSPLCRQDAIILFQNRYYNEMIKIVQPWTNIFVSSHNPGIQDSRSLVRTSVNNH